jgi:hypothetical protein
MTQQEEWDTSRHNIDLNYKDHENSRGFYWVEVGSESNYSISEQARQFCPSSTIP